jgi:hypothetical protein
MATSLGKKYSCFRCQTKFYDLGKPVPLCPKCGADQREADEAPVYTPQRGRKVVEPPVEEEEEETERTADDEDTVEDTPEPERDDDEEEEEY